MRRAAVLDLLAVLSVLAAGACSADRREHTPLAVATPSIATPLGLEARASASATPPLDAAGAAFSVEAFSPLLALPELSDAAVALDAGDPARAAHAVAAFVAARPPPPSNVQALQYLLARLREDSGDLAGATASYDLAAAAEGSLRGYACLGGGRVLLRSGHAGAALERLGRVPQGGPLDDEASLVTADAAALAGQPELAIGSLRRYLAGCQPSAAAESSRSSGASSASAPPPPEATMAYLRLGELLVDRAKRPTLSFDERAALGREALELARRAMSRAPTDVDLTARAHAVEMAALVLLPAPERTERARPEVGDELERLRALVEGKHFDAAVQLSDSILASLGSKSRSGSAGCEAELLRARALGGQHAWGKGADELGDVARRCPDPDVRARALFLGGKYADLDKRWALALRYYETLEHDLPNHRLADDARLRAAETCHEMGAEDRFTELLTRMPDDYPDGDMVLDGMFTLALRRVERGDWTAARTVLDRAASIAAPLDAKRGQEFAGRERYFRARAWAATGEDAERTLAEYEAMVRELPLSYYMLHAYSRLAEADAPRAARVLAEALEHARSAPFAFERLPDLEDAGFRTAFDLLRVSDIDRARRELTALAARKPDARPAILWSVALVYARAGASKLSNDLVRGLLSDSVARWPSGDWERAWQVAFPRPYHDIVEREAKRSGVPEQLVYAVMREESSFDPGAESPARAYGLMQLIVPTARQFGKGLGLNTDAESLKRPAVSVGIGCRVLSELTRSFSENPLLAVPGYNAGAGRPRRWLDERPSVDFDVWVELIPYLETRRYTKRVLASRAAYAFLYAPTERDAALRLPIRLVTR